MSDVKSFNSKKIRTVWVSKTRKRCFVVRDVVSALTDSKDVKSYLKGMRARDKALDKGWGKVTTALKVETNGGVQLMNCADKKNLLRIIEAIPNPIKLETFKKWLAKL